MTTLDPLSEPLVRLFLRIDAAGPSDEVLGRIWKFWTDSRADQIAPGEGIVAGLPHDLRPHVFAAHLSSNGTRHWLVAGPGRLVADLLSIREQSPIDDADKRSAVRLRRLFDLVAEKSEPYSAMFETKAEDGKTRLIEVIAAPLVAQEPRMQVLLAAANSRIEQL